MAVCAVIADALAGSERPLEELAVGLSVVGAPPEVADAVRDCASAGLAELELDERASMGYTVRAMTAGLWAYLHASDFESTLLQIVNAGGDADTNGAVAGAVLGARFGVAAIPERWRERLPDLVGLVTLADRLWAASR